MYFIETETGKMDIFQHHNSDRRVDPSIFNIPKSTKNYLICFTGRSGSTMLCSLLKQTEILGHPDEFTNSRGPMHGPMQMYLSRYSADNILQYFDVLRRALSSDNGVFGMKSSFIDFEPLLRAGLVGNCLNPVKWIYLTRRDLVLQAISFVRAKQSQIWHLMKDNDQFIENTSQELYYDEGAILKEIDDLIIHQHQWERFFSIYSINPLRITYEDMLEDVASVIEKIVIHMEIKYIHDITINDAETKKIGDEVNAQWARYFRAKFQI